MLLINCVRFSIIFPFHFRLLKFDFYSENSCCYCCRERKNKIKKKNKRSNFNNSSGWFAFSHYCQTLRIGCKLHVYSFAIRIAKVENVRKKMEKKVSIHMRPPIQREENGHGTSNRIFQRRKHSSTSAKLLE